MYTKAILPEEMYYHSGAHAGCYWGLWIFSTLYTRWLWHYWCFFLFFWIQLCLYISHSSVCVSVLLCIFAIICPPLLCLNHNLLHGGFSRLCFLHRATSQLPAGITARRVCHSGGNNLDKSMDFSFFLSFFLKCQSDFEQRAIWISPSCLCCEVWGQGQTF